MTYDRGIGRIVIALLKSTVFVNTLALDGCNSNEHSDQQSDPFSPSFTVVDCLELTSPDVVANILQDDPDITCGRVSVPANWEIPDGSMIELAVYRIAPTTYLPASDPVAVLAGGPGRSGIGILLDFVDADVAYLLDPNTELDDSASDEPVDNSLVPTFKHLPLGIDMLLKRYRTHSM